VIALRNVNSGIGGNPTRASIVLSGIDWAPMSAAAEVATLPAAVADDSGWE
jgi:hypothetical protein